MNFVCRLLIWSFLCCLLATRVQTQETEGEAAHEIRLGEWRDSPPAIVLCVVL
jgi:hypothetical protein